MAQAVQTRGVDEPIVAPDDIPDDRDVEAALDDDDAVDLLTQTQHVSGRSDPEQVFNPALQPINGNEDVAASETQEPYEDLVQDPVVEAVVVEQEEMAVSIDQLNGNVEATQTLGLADLEAFMEGEEEEEEIESEEEIEEEEEPTQAQENGHVDEPEVNGMEPTDNDDLVATTSTKASLGDAPKTIELEEEMVETVETQASWDIRKGKDEPVRPEQIIRGHKQKR